MSLRLITSAVLLLATAVAQNPGRIDCKSTPTWCEIEIGGQQLTLGMPKDQVLVLLSKTSYLLQEDHQWSAEHKPYSLWYLKTPPSQPFAGIKGGVKFKAEKLDGAMILWSPNSDQQSDYAASLINILERFSKEGLTQCTLTTSRTAHPNQEESEAMFQCGLHSIRIFLTRLQITFNGQALPAQGDIQEYFGNW